MNLGVSFLSFTSTSNPSANPVTFTVQQASRGLNHYIVPGWVVVVCFQLVFFFHSGCSFLLQLISALRPKYTSDHAAPLQNILHWFPSWLIALARFLTVSCRTRLDFHPASRLFTSLILSLHTFPLVQSTLSTTLLSFPQIQQAHLYSGLSTCYLHCLFFPDTEVSVPYIL